MSAIQRSVLRQLRELIRIPSRAGLDDYGPVFNSVQKSLRALSVSVERLVDRNRLVGVCGEIRGARDGPAYMLNATIDTAPFGDKATWTHDPISADVKDGWVFGRGSADSKAGVAIFCHVLGALARDASSLRGSMVFLFDAEEHSGLFGGVRGFVRQRLKSRPLAGVMIGYPGHERIIIGCRGFFRAKLTVHGTAAHSGSSSHRGVNAIARAAELVGRIQAMRLPRQRTARFPLPPQVTVTAARGGSGFSTVPDRCDLHVDVRLTPSFTRAHAEAALAKVIKDFDRGAGRVPATGIDVVAGWPAYRLPDDTPVYQALRTASRKVLKRALPGAVAGPSSVGNYLATLDIHATSGFGVRYRNIHSADECVEIASIEPTYQIYLTAARLLLK